MKIYQWFWYEKGNKAGVGTLFILDDIDVIYSVDHNKRKQIILQKETPTVGTKLISSINDKLMRDVVKTLIEK
jgi:hypothetical protein